DLIGKRAVSCAEKHLKRQRLLGFTELFATENIEKLDAFQQLSCAFLQGLTHGLRRQVFIHYNGNILVQRGERRKYRGGQVRGKWQRRYIKLHGTGPCWQPHGFDDLRVQLASVANHVPIDLDGGATAWVPRLGLGLFYLYLNTGGACDLTC